MAIYDPIVPRPKNGSRRASGDLPDGLQRVIYQQMLTEELGRRPEGFTPAEPDLGWRSLIVPIVAMLFLAALVLAGALMLNLWRSGEIGWRLPESGPASAQRLWQHHDRARPLEEPVPETSQIEEILEARRKPVEETAEELPVEVEE